LLPRYGFTVMRSRYLESQRGLSWQLDLRISGQLTTSEAAVANQSTYASSLAFTGKASGASPIFSGHLMFQLGLLINLGSSAVGICAIADIRQSARGTPN